MGNRYRERVRNLLALPDQGVDAHLIVSWENRFYLSGFSGSAGWLLVGGGERFLLTDSRYAEQAGTEAPDYDVVVSPSLAGGVGKIIADQGWKRVAIDSPHVSVQGLEQLRQAGPLIQWMPQAGRVETLRRVKDADEVACIRGAAKIADRALQQVMEMIRPGTSEKALGIALEHAMREGGAEALSFPTIVASGPRGSLPHAQPSARIMEGGDLVTIDFGAVFRGYHSDETVTVPVSAARANRQQRHIYDIVRQAQKAGLDMVKPGVKASAVDAAAREVIAREGFGDFFGHGTGHGVGLEVHEDPFIGPRYQPDFELEPGMVVTVEPGIYRPGSMGVRLEDTVAVTSAGYQRLTHWDKGWPAS